MMSGDKEGFYQNLLLIRKSRMKDVAKDMGQLTKKQKQLKQLPQTKETKEELKSIESEQKRLKDELTGNIIKTKLDEIENMKDIENVTYYSDGICILTKCITIGGKYPIGKYQIKINVFEHKIKIYRDDGRVFNEDVNHPFVRDGYPCYGIWVDTINKALANGGIFTVAMASIQLLKCYKNYNGWYMSPASFYREVRGD